MIRLLSLLALSISLLAAPLRAQCAGENLFATMDPDRLAAITAAADAVPFPRGNLWRATRGDEVITIIGTYHFDDPATPPRWMRSPRPSPLPRPSWSKPDRRRKRPSSTSSPATPAR
jgi:hypothetical protein